MVIVKEFMVYRNGELIDSTTETSYTDKNVTEFTVYNYSVSAINLGTTESDKSAEIKVAVGNDNSLPVLTGIKPISNDKFVVTFSKAMDKESAEKTENYIVSDGLKVTSAVFGDDLKSVTLTIEGVTSDTNAILYTENIADNTISKNICSSVSTVTVSLLSRWYKMDETDGECTVEVTFVKGEDSRVISFNLEAIASALKLDKSELFFLKAEAEELDNVYTVNSYKVLQEKIALAEQIIANPDATASDITDAVNQLTEAMEGLKYNKGDFNGDGKIDIIDTSLIQTYIIRKEVSGDFYLEPADSDGNGTINILDATMTQLVVSGK